MQAKRRVHNRLGFAVQLTSVRFLGRFMPAPRQVPAEVAEYLAGQLEIADVSCLKLYGSGTVRPVRTPGRSRRPKTGGTLPRSARSWLAGRACVDNG